MLLFGDLLQDVAALLNAGMEEEGGGGSLDFFFFNVVCITFITINILLPAKWKMQKWEGIFNTCV